MHDSYPGSGRDFEEDPSTSEDVRRSLRTSRRLTTAFRTFPVVPRPITFTTGQMYCHLQKSYFFRLYIFFECLLAKDAKATAH